MSETLTPDGLACTSAAALARVVGVHRDQVRLWRLNGAPDSLDLAAWRAWFIATGRTDYAVAIPASLAGEMAPPGAEDDADKLGDIKAEEEGTWKARAARAKALTAERELAESEGRLIERRLFIAAAQRLGAAVLDAIHRTRPWDELAPTLDGLTPAQRHAMRQAFDRWVLQLRGALTPLPQQVCGEIVNREGKS